MFPWSPEFAWDAYHVAFFGALYSVLATVAGTLAVAAWRARRDAREGRAAAIAWHGDFHEMPDSARACRHQITGKAPGRACENGFDCRPCAARALRGARPPGRASRRGRPLRLRPAARPPLPPRAHLGAARGRRHPHRRPRRPRPAPRRHAGAGGAARGRQPAPGERPRGPDHHPGPRGAGALPRGRHRRGGARRGRRCDAARRPRRYAGSPAPALRGRSPCLGAAGAGAAAAGHSARASWARPSPTAASWWRTWARPCPATATTRSSGEMLLEP